LVRDTKVLYRSMNMQASYLEQDKLREPMQWTPEMSRRARGVELWAALKSIGRSGVSDLIDRTCAHAVIAAIQRDGTCWCGPTFWRGRAAMRISVSSWATTKEDMTRSLNAVIRIAKEHQQ
jgi:hypothetical protein